MPTLLMGIDFGTGSCKVTVIDAGGRLVDEDVGEYPTSHPKPGWSEQNPDDWWRTLREILHRMKSGGRWKAGDVAAIALDSSTHNAVLLDAHLAVLRPVIMWTDQRSVEEARKLDREHGELIFRTAWQKPTPTWTLPQLAWLQNHEPEVLPRTAHLYFVKDHIRRLLTGEIATDHIDAQGTLMVSMAEGAWSEELCALARIPMGILPALRKPTDRAGQVTAQAARDTGLAEGTPVYMGCSDSAVEDYAAGAVADGQAVIKIATAGNVNVMTAQPRPNERTLTYSHVIPGLWYTVTATNAAGVSKRWFRDLACEGLGGGTEAYAAMDEAAERSPLGADGLLFHPYLSGERAPYWDSDLRASFTGLTMRHGRGDLVRAVMEGVAFSLRDCFRVIEGMGLPVHEIRFIGGGARSSLWRTIVADVFGKRLKVPAVCDASFGSALLAGVGAGVYPDALSAIQATAGQVSEVLPDAGRHAEYGRLFARYLAVHDALAPLYAAASQNPPAR
jgi:xylulokinase